MVDHKLGIVPNRKEPVTSEHIECKGYKFSSHDTSEGIQVSSYGDQNINYITSEVNIEDHHNIILYEQSQLHQIQSCLTISMCILAQIFYRLDNVEQYITTTYHVN